MASTTGRISLLPGSLHKVPDGVMCDNHNNVPALFRVQGETDSFGSEMADLCQECYDEYKADMDNYMTEAECERCGTVDGSVRISRDPEEGMCGPVYMMCIECRAEIHRNFCK